MRCTSLFIYMWSRILLIDQVCSEIRCGLISYCLAAIYIFSNHIHSNCGKQEIRVKPQGNIANETLIVLFRLMNLIPNKVEVISFLQLRILVSLLLKSFFRYQKGLTRVFFDRTRWYFSWPKGKKTEKLEIFWEKFSAELTWPQQQKITQSLSNRPGPITNLNTSPGVDTSNFVKTWG